MERRLSKARNYLSLPRKSSMNGQCRHASIRLLDGESLEVTILPRITVEELHNVVADHSGLEVVDRKYFGLAWIDENSKQYHWLSVDKKLLESELPSTAKTTGKIILHHNVKFFVDDFRFLSQVSTVQLYFLDTQQQLAREQLDLSISDHIQLASLLIHIFNGDYQEEDESLDLLRVVVPIPRRLAKDTILTQTEWENKVLKAYEDLSGLQRGTAIVRFMHIAQQSSTYGSRFYRVIDQSNSPCVLALNSKGIIQFDRNDISAPLRVFEWRHIDNIYYKECHFSIEVRNSRSVVREDDSKGEGTESNSRCRSVPTKHIYTFIVDSSFSCRSLWSSSISQHQFYLDQSCLQESNRSTPSTSQSEVDQSELCERLNRLVSKSSLAPSIHSLSSLHTSSNTRMPIVEVCDEREEEEEVNGQEENGGENRRNQREQEWKGRTMEQKAADFVRYKRLLQLKMDLKKKLAERENELRRICIAEGELTGLLPPEINLTLRPGEQVPKLKRRIGTSFNFTSDLLKTSKVDRVMDLETEVEINRKIVAAADRLAKDKNTNKSVRKKRQKDLAAAQSKLKGLESNLQQMRLSASKPDVSMRDDDNTDIRQWSTSSLRSNGLITSKSCPTTPRGSMPDLAGTVSEGEDEEMDGVSRPASCSLSRDNHSAIKMTSSISVSSSSAAPSGTSSSSLTSNSSMGTGRSVRRRIEEESEHPLRALPPSYDGYRSSASYKSSYRTVHYPTLQEQESRRKTDDDDDRGGFVNVKTGWEPYQHTSPLRVLPSRPSPYQIDQLFPTGSLDRRMNKRLSPTHNPMAPLRNSPIPLGGRDSRDSSPSTQRIHTTFPVSSNAPLVFRKPLSSQQSAPLLPSLTPSYLQGPSPSSLLSRLPPSSFSSSRLPSQPDPHIESLIDFYRDRQPSKTPKTATIV